MHSGKKEEDVSDNYVIPVNVLTHSTLLKGVWTENVLPFRHIQKRNKITVTVSVGHVLLVSFHRLSRTTEELAVRSLSMDLANVRQVVCLNREIAPLRHYSQRQLPISNDD